MFKVCLTCPENINIEIKCKIVSNFDDSIRNFQNYVISTSQIE